MDETVFVPNIETIADARNMEAVCMLDRLFVRVVVDDKSVEHVAAMIDEMNAILGQPSLLDLHADVFDGNQQAKTRTHGFLNCLESSHTLLTESKCISDEPFKLVGALVSAQPAQAEVPRDHEIS